MHLYCVVMPSHSLEVNVQLVGVICSFFMRDLNAKLRFLELTAVFYLLSHLSIPKIVTFFFLTLIYLPSRVAKSSESTSFNNQSRSFVLLCAHDVLLSLKVCSVTVSLVSCVQQGTALIRQTEHWDLSCLTCTSNF